MSLRKEEEIRDAIAEVFGEENEGMLCCTLETVNADGQDVSIQVMRTTLSISPYPFTDDPLTRLQLAGVMESFEDAEFETVDWDANAFATLSFGELEMEQVAELVDLVFVKVLSCTDGEYTFTASTEDLG